MPSIFYYPPLWHGDRFANSSPNFELRSFFFDSVLFTAGSSVDLVPLITINTKSFKNFRYNSGIHELQSELKPTEFLFEIFDYVPGTSGIENHIFPVYRRVQGPKISDFKPFSSVAEFLKSSWNTQNMKTTFVVFDRLVFDSSFVKFLQEETSIGALLLNNCQMNTKGDLDLSNNTSIKELYILASESFQGITITPPSKVEKLAVHLVSKDSKDISKDISKMISKFVSKFVSKMVSEEYTIIDARKCEVLKSL